jgi:hypothetical protein
VPIGAGTPRRLTENRVNSTESRFKAGLNRLLQQNLPEPDFCLSLNYLIGTRDERRRYGKPQLLGCLEVDGQLEFGYLVDGDVAGLLL